MVKAKNVDAYVDYMRNNTGPFEAIGADMAGAVSYTHLRAHET